MKRFEINRQMLSFELNDRLNWVWTAEFHYSNPYVYKLYWKTIAKNNNSTDSTIFKETTNENLKQKFKNQQKNNVPPGRRTIVNCNL